jgi:hypothetical protein
MAARVLGPKDGQVAGTPESRTDSPDSRGSLRQACRELLMA